MQHSASYISIPEVPKELFTKACRLAVSLNAGFVPPHETGAAMYIRPLLFGSSAQLGLSPPEEYTFCVYVMPTGVYHGVHPVDCLILEDFDRAAPHGTGSAKVGGNYAPVLRHSDKARSEGFGITLHLDSQTRSVIDEFSTSGFIGIKQNGDDITLVVPDSKNVIKSVTSDSAFELAKSFGWKVECRPVRWVPNLAAIRVCSADIQPCRSPTRSCPASPRFWPQEPLLRSCPSNQFSGSPQTTSSNTSRATSLAHSASSCSPTSKASSVASLRIPLAGVTPFRKQRDTR